MTEGSGRIVLFGATGHLGRAIARLLTTSGSAPASAPGIWAAPSPGPSGRVRGAGGAWAGGEGLVLAGRDRVRLMELALELGGAAEIVVADLRRPGALDGVVRSGDVVVSTAGPFLKVGAPPVEAVIEAGSVYLDSCCEPPFVRQVYETYGPLAERAGATLLPACGYANLAGVLAGSLALDEVVDGCAARVDVGYFLGGGTVWPTATAGMLRSIAGILGGAGYAYQKEIVAIGRPQVRDFTLADRARPAVTVGAAEHFALPRTHPGLQSVEVYMGTLGGASRLVVGTPRPVVAKIGGAWLRLMAHRAKGRTRYPTLTVRVTAVAYDPTGLPLAEVHLSGGDPYDFTARMLAWCARQVVSGERTDAVGAVGPVEAFGLGALQVGCAEAGISRLSG